MAPDDAEILKVRRNTAGALSAMLAACFERGVCFFVLFPVVRDLEGPEEFGGHCAYYWNHTHRSPAFVGIVKNLSYNEWRSNHPHMEQVSCSAQRGVGMMEGLATRRRVNARRTWLVVICPGAFGQFRKAHLDFRHR